MTRPRFDVLLAVSGGHFVNDLLQSLLPSIYPMLKADLRLDFWQIGLITLANQVTASVLQPVVGHAMDRRPQPYSLALSMTVTLVGLVLLAFAPGFGTIVLAAALIGVGSSVFHPESSRVARLASGGQHGLAQSLFQTGGNAGSAVGPLLAAFVVLRFGRDSIAWFSIVALAGIVMLVRVGRWYVGTGAARPRAAQDTPPPPLHLASDVRRSLAILVVLVFSKFVYMTSLANYYTFFLIDRFDVSVRSAQIHLFVFLAAAAVGTFAGGPLGDRLGRKVVIWMSILGVLPFSLALPHATLFWTGVLSVFIGLILSSAFSAILVYAQDLVPGRVGMVAGLFFGLAFGIGGIGAAVLGKIADETSVAFMFRICSILPALGLLTALLPPERHPARGYRPTGATKGRAGAL
jgi:FSR family fosmidomycin resistance protein-like MFS transporter